MIRVCNSFCDENCKSITQPYQIWYRFCCQLTRSFLSQIKSKTCRLVCHYAPANYKRTKLVELIVAIGCAYLQIKMLDGEKTKLCTEVNELQTRVSRDEEREEESRKENFGLKQKVGVCFCIWHYIVTFI